MPKIQIPGFQCNRCKHIWPPRSMKSEKEPVICPKCKTPYWNLSRKNKITKPKKGGTKK